MIILKTKNELTSYLSGLNSKFSIGFVPTMGALHKGHLALLLQAKKQCSVVVCSIFVNPTQFDSKEDFNNYPNTLSADITQLEKINCDVLYNPDTSDLYRSEEKAKHFDFNGLENEMEGKYRKGHFDGVATIIEKLFTLIKPQKAFFGQKDLQQLLIVKALTKKLNFPVEIIGVHTVREKNGLAMSSRNKLLNKEQLKRASLLYKSLFFCKENKETKTIAELKKIIHTQFSNYDDITLEYFEFASANSLQTISSFQEKGKNTICIAAFVGGVRLIDNIIF
ncbi:MAG: pantoate--beta-alanine ligase [Flavobacteriales bacterium]|nr:pantoate--beta-alanine ligase [Flavobacteriales bacterium]